MPLDPRPSPRDVATFFHAPLTEAVLAHALHVLRADPNWHVSGTTTSPTTHEIVLLYRPVGAPPLTIHLARAGSPAEPGVWRKTP